VDSPSFTGTAHQLGNSFGECDDANWAGPGFPKPAAVPERVRRACEEFMQMHWYAQPNDLIGGWCVMPADEPPSGGLPEVADFLTQEAAEHIALLHNQWLDVHGCCARPA
jgi:hypothetical protein